MKEADRIFQAELDQAKTEADLDWLVSLRRRSNNLVSDGKITADNEAYLISQLRMKCYERTRNQAGYRPLALAAGNRRKHRRVREDVGTPKPVVIGTA
ncbi:hypothetical protein [Fibrella arboris]|uniref:hypothetical protein n=1 Tax=Fibrella arboris TaxID=3242486 RepID=UPI0035219681